jgi:transposase
MRCELSDTEWSIIRAMLPTKTRGVPRADDRRVLNGIFWVLRSGALWRDLPAVYGPRTTCYNRFVRWRRAGVWESILQALTTARDAAVQMIDTSMVRVHQHAACVADSGNQAVGRSRGGLTSKLHVVVDGKGLPLRLGITAGQGHDNRLCSTLLSGLPSRTMVLADRGTTPAGSERLSTNKALGQTFRRNAIADSPSASVPTSIVRAIASRGSSTRSSIAGASPLVTTNSQPTTWRSCSWHQSAYGYALYEFTT